MKPGLGDRARDTSPAERKRVFKELTLLWLVSLLLIRVVVGVQSLGLPEWILALVPCIFIYAPVALCRWRGADSYAYRLSVPAFRNTRAWWRPLREALTWMALILVPFTLGYHLWQTLLFDLVPEPWRLVPRRLDVDWAPLVSWLRQHPGWERLLATLNKHGTLVLYQIFFVAIPEEFFYRGYMQTRLNEVFERRFLLFGIPFGHSLWITALLFAFGHSLVMIRWWHFAIFFPGLLFGLIRERSGNVLAGAFFHAFCNILVVTLDSLYGIG